MRRIIKLTESDLKKIVKRIIREAEQGVEPWLSGEKPLGYEKYNALKNAVKKVNNPVFTFDYVFRDTFNDNGFPKVYFIQNGKTFNVWFSTTTDKEAKPVQDIGKLPLKSELGFKIVDTPDGTKFLYNELTENGRKTGDLINQKTGKKMSVVFVNDNGVPEMGTISVTSRPAKNFEIGGKLPGKTKVKNEIGNNVGFTEYTVIDDMVKVPEFKASGDTPITQNEDQKFASRGTPQRPTSSLD